MAELSDQDIDAALARGREARYGEPRASAVRFERADGRVTVDLTNGCGFSFPARKVQGLERASDDLLAGVEILGGGYGLHWEALDVDVSVPGLLAGIFGTRIFMAREAGRVSSAKKAEAARANGAKGGRPRKVGV